jgi:hypothetical protein
LQRQWGKSQPVGCNITNHVFAPKIANKLKKGELKNAKMKTLDRISPFYLPPCSVLIIARGQHWRRGDHRSVGCNTMDHAFSRKMAT